MAIKSVEVSSEGHAPAVRARAAPPTPIPEGNAPRRGTSGGSRLPQKWMLPLHGLKHCHADKQRKQRSQPAHGLPGARLEVAIKQ